MLANHSRLLNVDYPVLRELEDYARYRAAALGLPSSLQPQQPEQGVNQTPEQVAFLEAVQRLEQLKGPAARRTFLEARLAMLGSPELRDKLVMEASRIEVQAVLEKVDSLKTIAAKRQHLAAALEAIRSDQVHDSLQAREIEWLDEALRSLDAQN